MNYRHLFHAGNFADVFKHAVLHVMLHQLQQKDSAYCFVDTHAGCGRYDLQAMSAQKTAEYRDGIGKMWSMPAGGAELSQYLLAVRAFNADGTLRVYPGSPLLARGMLRPQDRMVLCEKHPEECARLRAEFAGDRQVSMHERDGYEMLKGLLPPKERRGLVLIDPPYERDSEFDDILTTLEAAWQRWPTGIYAVWYPIKERSKVAQFHRRLHDSAWRKILVTELLLFPEDTAFRLNGCGLAILNPPWKLDESVRRLLPELRTVLGRTDAARVSLDWLKNDEQA
jgi:23S rRNA (adenine2030-N6)-methyltransferase